MCFRPPEVTKPKKCPHCGTLNPPKFKICRQCRQPFPEENQGQPQEKRDQNE